MRCEAGTTRPQRLIAPTGRDNDDDDDDDAAAAEEEEAEASRRFLQGLLSVLVLVLVLGLGLGPVLRALPRKDTTPRAAPASLLLRGAMDEGSSRWIEDAGAGTPLQQARIPPCAWLVVCVV